MDQQIDVVVVGAGPVGLLAAIELTLGGVGVLVLERLATASREMKAGGLGPLGLEALERRGMGAAIAAAEARSFAAMAEAGADPRTKGSKYSGHFAGLSLIRKDAQREPGRRSRPVDQQAVEAMLAVRAHALGIEVRRECNVTSFVQQADGVDLEWTSPRGADHIRSSYLVGCDGGRSFIRKMAGFEFPGSEPSSTFYQAIAQIDHPERLAPMGWRRTSGGMFSYGPFPGRLVMLEFSGPPEDRQAPVTRDEIEDVLRRVSGAEVRVKALESGSRWTDNTRLVDSYRKGRVLLAGDAAHIHTPFGGQGLTLGLVDAANLGWKLAAVVRSGMPDSLLDTYTAERRPVAEAVLANTLAQVAIMRPDPQSGAMRDLVAKLLDFDEVNGFIGEMTSGLSIRYDLGAERDEVGRLIGNREINHGAPGLSLYDVMQRGLGILLDASTEGRASKFVQASTQRVRCVGVDKGPSMLIRPDACVAWTGRESSTAGLEEALDRWFIPALNDSR
jgi:2-polyprenyl-6-methoxyphenol hydroxylase-like FAD-dependent oxidoreductase